ncbi:MAG: sigma-70 family RNA polymerase sigma factor [Ruminococcus sp.]|nr:sigma-70 family RNA polymerase sigma factor [Ruminococcus sp.]
MILSKAEREKFTEENLGLVHMCAKKFAGKGFEYDDLYGTGCIGLMKAIDGFDTERGTKFSTYAVPLILGEIKRLFRDGGTLKVSRSVKELSLKLSAITENIIKRSGREPTVSELAEAVGAPLDDVIEALSASMPVLSLTVPDDDENGRESDIASPAPDADTLDVLALRQALAKLDLAEQKLAHYRFFKCLTQAQTAKILGTSQVQISRNEKKLLRKMKEFLMT